MRNFRSSARYDSQGRSGHPPTPPCLPAPPENLMLRALSNLAEKILQIISDLLSRSQRRFWL